MFPHSVRSVPKRLVSLVRIVRGRLNRTHGPIIRKEHEDYRKQRETGGGLTRGRVLATLSGSADSFMYGEWGMWAIGVGKTRIYASDTHRVTGTGPSIKRPYRNTNTTPVGSPGAKNNPHTGPRWGRMACAMALGKLIKRKRTTTTHDRKRDHVDPWANIHTGGWQLRDIVIKNHAVSKNRVGNKHVALPNWVDWRWPNSTAIKERMGDRLLGGGFQLVQNGVPRFVQQIEDTPGRLGHAALSCNQF